MKHTQHDLVVLSLASHREWRRGYELERQVVGREMVGSEADTRLYELFDKQVPDAGEAKRVIDGDTYTIETKKEGTARLWRAYLLSKKPKFVAYVRHPLTGERITTEELAAL